MLFRHVRRYPENVALDPAKHNNRFRNTKVMTSKTASQNTLTSTPVASDLNSVLAGLDAIILGNPFANKLALVCLLAQGHLLIEDIPGVGKTTLSHHTGQFAGSAL